MHSIQRRAWPARGARIGLWDMVSAATPAGSLDQAIRDAQHNRIEHLLRDYPELRAIAFNGGDRGGGRPQADRRATRI